MGIVSEYLKLIPVAYKNREKIAEGIITKVKSVLNVLPEDEQEEIIRRRFICEDCPFNSKNAQHNELKYKTDREDDHCIHCLCNIEYKCSCLSCNCGIEVWNQNHSPEERLELKWTAYKKTT